MIGRLRDRLRSGVEFPSPPAVAQQIVALAADPEIDVLKVAAVMARDPGLAAKIMRVANSPIYSKQRKSDSLRQALIILGLNTATNLALGFTLVNTYRVLDDGGFDYARYWRRAILCATAARAIGQAKRSDALEDIFLAALLQDIAILAIERTEPEFYAALSPQATHAEFIAHENARLGQDHAALGGWLLRSWKLPDALCRIVEVSHTPTLSGTQPRIALCARAIALGSEVADLLMNPAAPDALAALSLRARTWLGLSSTEFGAVIERIVAEAPEIEKLFDTKLLEADVCSAILERARELLAMRNPAPEPAAEVSPSTSETVVARTLSMAEMQDRDPLTCAFHKEHFDGTLNAHLAAARNGGWPLTLVIVDPDRLRRVNELYGHPTGDAVLFAIARILNNVAGDTGYVARIGGEEFAVLLPRIGTTLAKKVVERMLLRLRSYQHAAVGRPFVVTASAGLATASRDAMHSTDALVSAAHTALLDAKAAGRDRLVALEGTPGAPLTHGVRSNATRLNWE